MRTMLILIFAVFIVSWSSIFIRWMKDLHPLVISFYRLALSALFLLPWAFPRFKSVRIRQKRILPYMVWAGIFLALHFFFWIDSLQKTTVGNSIFLESTHPLFALLLSMFFLKEKASKAFIPALVFGLTGMYLTVHRDIYQNMEALSGDLMAVFSAFCIAAYLLFARKTKHQIDLLPYLVMVYSIAAMTLLPFIVLKGLSLIRISYFNFSLLLLLALGPSMIGHSLLNWASRRMPIYKVNMALLGEAVLATFYAAILLNEIPSLNFYIGAILILISIGLVFRIKTEVNI